MSSLFEIDRELSNEEVDMLCSEILNELHSKILLLMKKELSLNETRIIEIIVKNGYVSQLF
jgi:hypothetical protein